MGKTRRKIAEVVSTTETTPVKEDNIFDQDAYNKKVLDKKQKELDDNTVTIDAGTGKTTTTGAALSNAVQPQEKAVVVEPSTPAPGVALNNAIQSNTAAQATENAVLKAGINNAETAGQVFEAPKVAEEAKKEAEKMQTQLDVETVNTVKAIEEEEPPLGGNSVTMDAGTGQVTTTGSGQYVQPAMQANQATNMPNAFTSMSEEQKQAYGQATANQLANQTVDNLRVAPAAYNAVTGGPTGPIRPSYEAITNKEQVERDVAAGYKDVAGSIPQAVVEKLGVQDYYPEIGRDIAVGTFTGSRIGSQTIYSGAGGLLPMGLYDERKRALVKAAKEKQAKIDKFMEIPDTSEQFNSDYKQGAFSFIQDGMAKHNWDLNAAMKDKEFMKGYYRWQTMGKEITYTDGIVDAIVDSQISKDGKAVPYVPAGVLDQAYKFREGKLDNMEDIMSGKSKIMDYAKNMRNYQNGAEWADGMIAKWSDPAKRVELPMNLKTGKEIDEKAMAEIQDSIKKLKENTGSYDSFLNVVKKHYDLDESLVGEWANLNNLPKDDPSRQWLKDYILKQMPADSLIENVERQSNNNYNYWAKRGDWAREDKAKETELTKIINNANNLNLKSKLDQISKNPNLNDNQKQVAIKNLYAEAGYNPRVGANGEIFGIITLGGGDVRKQNVTLNANNAEVMIYNKANKKNEWVSVGKAMKLKGNKNYVVDNDIDTYFKNGNAVVVPNEIRIQQTYTGNNGKQYQLKATNLGAYASTNNKEMTTTTYGNVYIAPKEKDGPSDRSKMQVRFNSRPETSIQDRSMMDDILKTNQPFATDPGYQGNTGTNYK
jgi:hypothetical protein